MTKLTLILTAFALTALARPAIALSADAAIDKLVAGQRAFAADMYAQLKSQPGNLMLSPYSIQQALAMTYAGAAGATANQMAAALRFEECRGDLHPAFAALSQSLKPIEREGREPFTLEIANSLWGEKGLNFKESFQAVIRDHYGGGLEGVEFSRDPESARSRINNWVSERTRERIVDLFPSGTIHSDTRLVLANAIYMKGAWRHPFQEYATKSEDFHLLDGGTAQTAMMNQTERFAYAETGGVQIVQLPYDGGSVAMLIALPKAGEFAEYEGKLDAKRLAGLSSDLEPVKVRLTMPRFEFSAGFALAEPLAQLGMRDAFSASHADFSGMTDDARLKIDAVVHKAFIRVDEKGTEAAAATGVSVGVTSMPPPEKIVEMRIDRPFVFVIQDTKTGAVLFMGRVVDPRT